MSESTESFSIWVNFIKLIEQKLEKDTLYVICISGCPEKKLHEVMTDYVKLTNDLPTSSQKTLKLLSSLMKDYVKSVSCRNFKFKRLVISEFGFPNQGSLCLHWPRQYILRRPNHRVFVLQSAKVVPKGFDII